MKRVPLVVAAALLSLSSTVWADGLSVLGFELGTASPDQVAAAVSPKGKVQPSGTNPYSGGPMLKADGSAFSVEGLDEVIFIFDTAQHLKAVVMKMDKSRFDTVFERLKGKYAVVASEVPRVGDKLVRFHEGTTTIELGAAHMSFEMNVRYIDDALLAKFEAASKKEAIEKEKQEASQF